MVTPNCVITDAGREIMRRISTSGLTVKSASFAFTKVAFGNGEYTEEEQTESYLRSATTLKSQKNAYPVTSLKKVSASDPQNMLYRVSTIAYNYNVATETVLVSTGYYITEIGIYAKATGGSESLVAIALIGDTTDTSENDYMPGVDPEEEIEGQIYQIVYDLYFGYSNVELDATVESTGAAFPMEDGQALEALISPGTGTGAVVIKAGNGNTADGNGAVAVGVHNNASGNYAFAAGYENVASGDYASTAGSNNTASGNYTLAMGSHNTASGVGAVATGSNNTANGDYASATGYGNVANGTVSSAMGNGTIANCGAQSVRGRYNVEDDVTILPYGGAYADIVGNGTSDNNRSNAYALTWYGDAHYALDTRNVSAAPADDRALYAAIVALGWESEVIV